MKLASTLVLHSYSGHTAGRSNALRAVLAVGKVIDACTIAFGLISITVCHRNSATAFSLGIESEKVISSPLACDKPLFAIEELQSIPCSLFGTNRLESKYCHLSPAIASCNPLRGLQFHTLDGQTDHKRWYSRLWPTNDRCNPLRNIYLLDPDFSSHKDQFSSCRSRPWLELSSHSSTAKAAKTINLVIASALIGPMDESGKSSVMHPKHTHKSKSPQSDFIQP